VYLLYIPLELLPGHGATGTVLRARNVRQGDDSEIEIETELFWRWQWQWQFDNETSEEMQSRA